MNFSSVISVWIYLKTTHHLLMMIKCHFNLYNMNECTFSLEVLNRVIEFIRPELEALDTILKFSSFPLFLVLERR